MHERRLRLGDILDDYCPRERRVTNHVVVAIVDDDVKQTRCSTCDAEHEYRKGKAPPARRPKSAAALAAEVAEGTRPHLTAQRPSGDVAPMADEGEAEEPQVPLRPAHAEAALPALQAQPAEDQQDPEPSGKAESNDPREDDGPVHRRLIRATFPRPEGQVPERREPEFTVRQPGSRGGRGEVDGNSVGYRSRGPQDHGFGGSRGSGGRPHGGGFGADGQRGRGPGGRGSNRPGGGGQNRGPRQGGGPDRKGGR